MLWDEKICMGACLTLKQKLDIFQNALFCINAGRCSTINWHLFRHAERSDKRYANPGCFFFQIFKTFLGFSFQLPQLKIYFAQIFIVCHCLHLLQAVSQTFCGAPLTSTKHFLIYCAFFYLFLFFNPAVWIFLSKRGLN